MWVQVPLPAPRRSKLRCTASTGTAERLCLLTFVPLRLLLLSNPNPLRWASDLFFVLEVGRGEVPTSFLRSKKDVIHSVTSVSPFKTEARGFGFVFGRRLFRSVCSSFQIRSHRLRVCGWGGIRFGLFVHSFNLKPEAWGLGWCVLGFAAGIFFDCAEEGFAVFGGLDFADAGDVQELVHVPGRAGGHVH